MPRSNDRSNNNSDARYLDGGRLPNSVGADLSRKAQAEYLRELLTKLQGYEPDDEQIGAEMGPQPGGSLGTGSGSYVQSLAPLQTMLHFNPGNRMIEALLKIATTRKQELG